MEGLPILSVPLSSRGSKRSKPDGGIDGKKKEKNGVKKAYIPSYVQAGEKCVVCGDNSTGTHYRAMTCEGCKGFFRRTIQKSKGGEPNLACKKEGNCEMTPQTRNACQFCRYKKCLAVKMDPASVLNEIERCNLQRLIATNRKERQKRNKRSLSSEEWGELRQIAQSYKSPSIHTFFSFFSQNNGALPKSYDVSKMTSPGVWHAFNFVRNIPGLDKISSDDLAVLIKNRLVDVLALLMAEVYNVAENELCFCDFRLRESDLERICPQLKNIFKYAKFYSKFVSHDGMVLGCLSATRFLNPDGLELRDPEKVDIALDYVVNLSLKFWASLENNTLLKELCKGLPDFENIREHEMDLLSRISMMNENLEDIKILIQLHPLPDQPEVMSPEYVNRSTSTAPSLRSSSVYTTDSSEDETDSLKLEMSCDEDVRSEQETHKGSGYVCSKNQIEMQKKNVAGEVAPQNVALTSALFGGNGYSWQSSRLPSVSFSSKSEDRFLGSQCSTSKVLTESILPKTDSTSYGQSSSDIRRHGVIQQNIQSGSKDTSPGVIQQKSPEIIQQEKPRTNQANIQGVIQQRSHEQNVQFVNTSKSPELKTSERPPFIHPRLDNLMSMDGPTRSLPRQNALFHSQGDIGASGALFQHNDIDNLRKNNENLKEMLKYMCTLMEMQGLYPNLENLENMLSKKDHSPGFLEREVNGILRTFTNSVPASQTHNLSILHHPAVTRALASRQLSYIHETSQNKHYPSSSVQSPFSLPSHGSFLAFPEFSQNENPVPDVAPESIRLYHQSNKIESNPLFPKNGHNSAFYQVLQQTDKHTSQIFDHFHNNKFITQDSVASNMPLITHTTDSNQASSSPTSIYKNYSTNNIVFDRFDIASSNKPSNLTSDHSHKLSSPLHDPKHPSVSFISNSTNSGTEKSSLVKSPPQTHSSAIIVNKLRNSSSNYSLSSQIPNNPPMSFTSHTAHSSAENSSPVNSTSQISSSNMRSGATVSDHSRSPQASTILEEPRASNSAIGLKKKWLRAHFNME